MKTKILAMVLPVLLMLGCGGEDVREAPADTDSVSVADSIVVLPRSPMEVALDFSNRLRMNDPSCIDLLSTDFTDTLPLDSLSPQQVFGRWRAFDAGGRLTAIDETPRGKRTSYYCTIRRMEMPAINRIDFLLAGDRWLIDGFGVELPRKTEDSLTVEQIAELALRYPRIRRELHVARMLYDDCIMDSVQNYASMNAAISVGTDFRDFVMDLRDESYAVLAQCNIRRAGKYQIMKDRAEISVQGLPPDLISMMNIIKEMAYLSKSVLRARHEAVQQLYVTGEWVEPDISEDATRLAGFRNFFLGVSNLVEARDTLSRTWPVLLTAGSGEPLGQIEIDLDPHQVDQRSENDLGLAVWRALAVEMNGDDDPERVVYWAGNLYLFQGTPTGYRLVWRTFEGYDSDYHADFVSQPAGRPGCREITFTGVGGGYDYFLGYSDEDVPLFRRIRKDASVPGGESGSN